MDTDSPPIIGSASNEEQNSNQREEAQQVTEVLDIWETLFTPKLFKSLYDPFPSVKTLKIQLITVAFSGPDDGETIEIDIFPFYTLNDVKMAIYSKQKLPEFVPQYQFLAEAVELDGKQKYKPIDFYWIEPGTKDEMSFKSPLEYSGKQKGDARFVDDQGEAKVGITPVFRGRSLYEDVYLKDKKEPVLCLFLLKDILAIKNTVGNESQYLGRIKPYFADRSVTSSSNGKDLDKKEKDKLAEQKKYFDIRAIYLKTTLSPLFLRLNPMNQPKIEGIKYLKLVWLKQGDTSIEKVFYRLNADESRPFIRLLPVDSVPITKLHVKGVLPQPDIKDPCLLLQWAKEKSPSVRNNFMFSKIVTGDTYATLQLLNDGTGALVLEPPRGVFMIDDLNSEVFKEAVKQGIEGMPFAETEPFLNEGTFIATINTTGKKLEGKELKNHLKPYLSFFQPVPPPPNTNPLLSLRYRAVSNYFPQDIIQVTMSQMIEQGKDPRDIIGFIQKEYTLSFEEATNAYSTWVQADSEVMPVRPKNNIYKKMYNPGIDILITSRHPTYQIQIQRVDSATNLTRILTLLMLMFTTEVTVSPVVAESLAKPVAAVEASVVAAAAKKSAWKPGDLLEEEDEEEGPPELPVAEEEEEEEAKEEEEEANSDDEAPLTESQAIVSKAGYFITKLTQADKDLFTYGQGEDDVNGYVSVCSYWDGRQPSVMDEATFQRFKDKYADDIRAKEIEIVEVSSDKPLAKNRKSNLADVYKGDQDEIDNRTFVILKYGTKLNKQSYYGCSEYYCLHDEIMLRKDEFLGTEFRANADPKWRGKEKQPMRCPFCNGRLMNASARARPVEGETVYKRKDKPGSKNKPHKFIGFYTKDFHPKHWGLPCCFVRQQELPPTGRSKKLDFFAKQRELLKKGPVQKPKEAEEAEEEEKKEEIEEEEEEKISRTYVDYDNILRRLHDINIVQANKIPLDINMEGKPQVGLVPSALDVYFQQDPNELITKGSSSLKQNAQGFLRIAVDNRISHKADSFFAAIAPILLLKSASQVRDLLVDIFTDVRRFVSANYGNLLLEFYNPALPNSNPIDVKTLKAFAHDELDIKIPKKTQWAYLARIKKAHENFMNFLVDPTRVKEYRQFAHILSQPFLLPTARKGIAFIVLELDEALKLKVRCPPYGLTDENNDLAFLLHKGDLWEPVFYIQSTAPGKYIPMRKFQTGQALPDTVMAILKEFRERCSIQTPTIYTGIQQMVPSTELPTLTELLSIVDMFDVGIKRDSGLVGVVRDTYNHIVAVTVEDEINEQGKIAFPVIDDGRIRKGLSLYMNWDGFEAAPADTVYDLYEKYAPELLQTYKGYKPVLLITLPIDKKHGTREIKAMKLENGIFIPVRPPIDDDFSKIPTDDTFETIEWTINKRIGAPEESIRDEATGQVVSFVGDKKETSGSILLPLMKEIQSEKEVEEVYEHFRLSFSNWLLRGEGAAIKKQLRDIIMPAAEVDSRVFQPVYKKREMLELLFSGQPFQGLQIENIMNWFTTEKAPASKTPALLRIDCLSLNQTQCEKSNRCVWMADEESHQCRLHVPGGTDMKRIFILRLIEELIRFPRRRDQILEEHKRQVGVLSKITGAIRIDDQYIVPEDTSEWADLLNIDCKRKMPEVARFFEEKSSIPFEKADVEKQENPEITVIPLPDFLIEGVFDDEASKYELLPLEETTRLGDNGEAVDLLKMSLGSEDDGSKKISRKEQKTLRKLIGSSIFQLDENLDSSGEIAGLDTLYLLIFYNDTVYIVVPRGTDVGPLEADSLPDGLKAILGIE